MKEKVIATSVICFVAILQITFIVLKLCQVINWSWWQVMLPSLINVGLIILLVLMTIVICLVVNKE